MLTVIYMNFTLVISDSVLWLVTNNNDNHDKLKIKKLRRRININ